MVDTLRGNNPDAEFIAEKNTANSALRVQRIGAKLDFWCKALQRANTNIVTFLDADMIVRDSLANALPPDADILITAKEEAVPINTGLVIARCHHNVLVFMEEWRKTTAQLAANPDVVNMDFSNTGGIDQHTLLSLLGTDKPSLGTYFVKTNEFGIRFLVAPCSVYNETRSVPLSSPAKVLHYKGAWQRIILKGKGYNSGRTKEASKEMLDLWFTMLKQEEQELSTRLMPLAARLRRTLNNQWAAALTSLK